MCTVPRPCQLCWRDCPYNLWLQDSSTIQFQCTAFLKLEFHYSSCASCFAVLVIPRRYAPGIVRLTLQTSSQLVGIRFQLGSLSTSVIKSVSYTHLRAHETV